VDAAEHGWGKQESAARSQEEEEDTEDEEEEAKRGYTLIYDVVRRFA